jgi:hypothetical protein
MVDIRTGAVPTIRPFFISDRFFRPSIMVGVSAAAVPFRILRRFTFRWCGNLSASSSRNASGSGTQSAYRFRIWRCVVRPWCVLFAIASSEGGSLGTHSIFCVPSLRTCVPLLRTAQPPIEGAKNHNRQSNR